MLNLAILLLLAAPATTQAAIQIDCVEPVVERVTFDPAHPPKEMSPLAGNESAFTQFRFDCRVRLKYEIVSTARQPGGVEVVARLREIRVTTAVQDTIYLPDNANLPLRMHEEGHREINERIYRALAQSSVEAAANDALSRAWPGHGADEDGAGKVATDAAVKSIGRAFQDVVAGWANRAGERFDLITDHGRRPVKIEIAIERAMDETKRDATTKP